MLAVGCRLALLHADLTTLLRHVTAAGASPEAAAEGHLQVLVIQAWGSEGAGVWNGPACVKTREWIALQQWQKLQPLALARR